MLNTQREKKENENENVFIIVNEITQLQQYIFGKLCFCYLHYGNHIKKEIF